MKKDIFFRIFVTAILLAALIFSFITEKNPYRDHPVWLMLAVPVAFIILKSSIYLVFDIIRYRKWKKKRPWEPL